MPNNLEPTSRDLKKCSRCSELKPRRFFYTSASCRDGLYSQCKECRVEKQQTYFHTLDGCIHRMYNNIKERVTHVEYPRNAAYRNVRLEISWEDFYYFVKNNPYFARLFEDWVQSNYDTKLSPSIDRIDSSGHYTLDNIQIITSHENNLKRIFDNAFKRECKRQIASLIKTLGDPLLRYSTVTTPIPNCPTNIRENVPNDSAVTIATPPSRIRYCHREATDIPFRVV